MQKREFVLFYKAAIDIDTKKQPLNKRFISCVRFVADEATPAVFYINTEWSKQNTLQTLNWHPDSLTPIQARIVEEMDLLPKDPKALDSPTLVYLVEGSWSDPADPKTGAKSGPIVPKREFVLSSSDLVHKAHLRDNGLNAQTAILCLAAVGLDVMLPNVSFDLVANDEIERFKEDLAEERHRYLEVVSCLAQQAFERLNDGDYKDVLRWAEAEVAFKLVPRARIIEEATSSLAARHLRRAGYSFWKDGVPAIGSAYVSGGIFPAGLVAGQAALKTLLDSINMSRSERVQPEIAYAIKISKALHGRGNLS
jgi:hypothetical protein